MYDHRQYTYPDITGFVSVPGHLNDDELMGSHSSPLYRTGLAKQSKLFLVFLSQVSHGLSRMSMRAELERLHKTGNFWISKSLYQMILASAGENKK